MSMERLPCGCQMGTSTNSAGEEVFLFEPHAMDCEYYLYVLDESARQGKPVTTLDVR